MSTSGEQDAPLPRRGSADRDRAERVFNIILDRWEKGERPLRHRELAQIEGLARQHLIVKVIPLMQRLAMSQGYYLARPARNNGYALTLTQDQDTAFLPELLRAKYQASMRLNDGVGNLIKALSDSPDYRHHRLADRLYNSLQAALWQDRTIAQDIKEARQALGVGAWDDWPGEEI